MFKKFHTHLFVIFSLLLTIQTTCAKDVTAYGPKEFSDENKWTAIVAAYAPEINAIDEAFSQLADAKIEQTLTIKGVQYQLGSYKGEPVVIFTTGVSVPNAAMTMQMALDYFPIDRVVMMGIAGAVSPDFQPGDISVPERWYFHDESVYVNPDPKDANNFVLPSFYEDALQRYKKRREQDPHSPAYENFGYVYPEEMAIVKQGWDKPRQMPYFTATPELIKLTKKSSQSCQPNQDAFR